MMMVVVVVVVVDDEEEAMTAGFYHFWGKITMDSVHPSSES